MGNNPPARGAGECGLASTLRRDNLMLATLEVKMRVGKIDFGPKDARHAFAEGEENEKVFQNVFVEPYNIELEEFSSGRRCFVYGIKGSGKSAFLRFFKLTNSSKSISRFVYFSKNLKELQKSRDRNLPDSDSAPADEIRTFQDPDEYWSAFFFLLFARMIYENDFSSGRQFLEFVRRQTTNAPKNFFDSIFRKAPTLETWGAQLSQTPSVDLKGTFDSIVNLSHFYQSSISILSDVRFKKPYYILVDELEIAFQSNDQFSSDVKVADSLVRVVRDLNEELRSRKIPIFIIAAIRTEVAKRVIGGDTAKIVGDLGRPISWERAARDNDEYALHPLFRIVLNRILYSENESRTTKSQKDYETAIKKYFPFYRGTHTQRYLLDLTTYRPRDIAILFGEAQQFHRNDESFEFETFKRKCRKNYRTALWTDFAEAMRSLHSERIVEVLGRVIFTVPDYFGVDQFVERLDDYSGDPDIAKIIDEYSLGDWHRVFKELYELGAIGHTEPGNHQEENLKFHFRGDTEELIIGRTTQLVKPMGLRAP